MRFVIISHTKHYKEGDRLLAYGPYVREMNLWTDGMEEVIVLAPLEKKQHGDIHEPYSNVNVRLVRIPSISLTSVPQIIRALIITPYVFLKIFFNMSQADHVHLRCPGNIGLLGCIAQCFYPSKRKTAKYAGNWDPGSGQPWSYQFQKWILANRFLSRNMRVLVYGEWPGQSENIVPFFTASYAKDKIEGITTRIFQPPFRFLFVGSLAPGKRPLYAIRLIEQLITRGVTCCLDIYGDGAERPVLEQYLDENRLEEFIKLHGNVSAPVVEKAYRKSHILLLPSRSEGWPKAVAEAMFWGVIPAVTAVSCVPWMLGGEKRGILLDMDIENDVRKLEYMLSDDSALNEMSQQGQRWSQQYTTDAFKEAIQDFL